MADFVLDAVQGSQTGHHSREHRLISSFVCFSLEGAVAAQLHGGTTPHALAPQLGADARSRAHVRPAVVPSGAQGGDAHQHSGLDVLLDDVLDALCPVRRPVVM